MARKPVRRRRKRRSPWQGTLRLGVVFAVLIAVNAYFLFLRRGTSVADLVRLSGNKELAAAVVAVPAKPVAPKSVRSDRNDKADTARIAREKEADALDEGRARAGRIGAGETLGAALRREGLSARLAADLVTAGGKLLDAKALHPGDAFTLRFDPEEHLRAIEVHASAGLVRVERVAGRDTFRAVKQAGPEATVVPIGAFVETTLDDALSRAGESAQLAAMLSDVFAAQLTFHVDAQAGDKLRLLVEKRDGAGAKIGRDARIVAAEYAGKAGTFRAFHDADTNGWFDEYGESLDKSLLKSPLRHVRLPAGSTAADRKRLRPVLHTEDDHLGVDWAAPAGTPVWAITDGTVTFKGTRGAAGDCVVIASPGGTESVYLHLGRFARGLEVGQAVRQKQVIGYLGDSPGVTAPSNPIGPHLHLSVKMGGHFVDPLRLAPAREAPIPAARREAFIAAASVHLAELARIEVRPPPKGASHPAQR